jgi:hypothetical protein
VDLGPGRGIRDLTKLDKGWLILSGDDGHERSAKGNFTLHRWDGASSAAPLWATLPASDGKAEGLWLMNETSSEAELMIIYDGLKKGDTTRYRLKK